jgi:hypothetical protein
LLLADLAASRTGKADSQRTIAFHVAGYPGNGAAFPEVAVLPPPRRLVEPAVRGAVDNPL